MGEVGNGAWLRLRCQGASGAYNSQWAFGVELRHRLGRIRVAMVGVPWEDGEPLSVYPCLRRGDVV
ncbi:MAG: hypothetical protein NZ807_05035 [Dehalococcoidia bacterium]|nr:hypothetical protein [Dehalococcoidia bacterium]